MKTENELRQELNEEDKKFNKEYAKLGRKGLLVTIGAMVGVGVAGVSAISIGQSVLTSFGVISQSASQVAGVVMSSVWGIGSFVLGVDIASKIMKRSYDKLSKREDEMREKYRKEIFLARQAQKQQDGQQGNMSQQKVEQKEATISAPNIPTKPKGEQLSPEALKKLMGNQGK